MIVADTSALFAIVLGENDASLYAQAIKEAQRVLIGAPTLFELRLVTSKRTGAEGQAIVDAMLARFSVEIVSFTAEHVALATDALLRFGGRPARLNYGDCMAYAVARALDVPLLFKGGDFARTDIRAVL